MNKPYELIRTKDNKSIFAATYAKHIYGGAFCALMEEYPSDNTRVLLCQRVEKDPDYGYRLHHLVSHGMGGGAKTIGHYVTMGEVRSEQEAVAKVDAHIKGTMAIAELLSKK